MKDDLRFADVTTSHRRVAVLVDGENLAVDHAAAILAAARDEGRVDIKRVYGNAKAIPAWDAQPAFRLIHSGTGKNATDMLLAIDAMELAFGGGIDTVLIASSDRDFAHVAHRLRERGLRVIGLGEAKTSYGFRQACTRFTLLVPRAKPIAEAAAPHTTHADLPPAAMTAPLASGGSLLPAMPVGVTDLDLKIRDMIRSHTVGNRGMRIDHLAPKMHTSHKVKISATPQRTWRAYLSSKPELYGLEPKDKDAHVRYIPRGFVIGLNR